MSPTEPADEVPVPSQVVERDRPEDRDTERSPSVIPETARASPEGEHRQRRRKRRRDRPEGKEPSHREKKGKKEKKEKEKKRRREDSPRQERKSAKTGEAPAKAGEVPKERGAVKSQPVVKAPPVAPPPPKAFPYGRTAGGLPRMLLWNVKEIPSGYFAKAKAAPAEGEPVKPVFYRGAPDEISMASRQVIHQLTKPGQPMVGKASKGKGKGKEKAGKTVPAKPAKGKGKGKGPTPPVGPPKPKGPVPPKGPPPKAGGKQPAQPKNPAKAVSRAAAKAEPKVVAKVEKKKEDPKAAVPKPGTNVPESSSSSSTTESELYEPEEGPVPQPVTGTTSSGTPSCPVVKQEEVKEETKVKEELPAPIPREAEVVEYQDELVREGLPEETAAPMAAASVKQQLQRTKRRRLRRMQWRRLHKWR